MENAERKIEMKVHISRRKWSWDTTYRYTASESRLSTDGFVPVAELTLSIPLPSEESMILAEIESLDAGIRKVKTEAHQAVATLEEAKQKLLALPSLLDIITPIQGDENDFDSIFD